MEFIGGSCNFRAPKPYRDVRSEPLSLPTPGAQSGYESPHSVAPHPSLDPFFFQVPMNLQHILRIKIARILAPTTAAKGTGSPFVMTQCEAAWGATRRYIHP